MFRKDKLLEDAKKQLDAVKGHVELLAYASKAKDRLQKCADTELKLTQAEVEQFHKDLRAWKELPIAKGNEKFEAAIYSTQIALTRIKPLNDTDYITHEDIKDIDETLLFPFSTGHLFNIQGVVQWLQTKKEWIHPSIKGEISPLDKLAIIAFAKDKLSIDLTAPAVSAAASAGSSQAAERKQQFSLFSPTSSFIGQISDVTGVDRHDLVAYQAQHPHRFNQVAENLVPLAPYFKNKLITLDQAGTLNRDGLAVLQASAESKEQSVTQLKEKVELVNAIGGFRRTR